MALEEQLDRLHCLLERERLLLAGGRPDTGALAAGLEEIGQLMQVIGCELEKHRPEMPFLERWRKLLEQRSANIAMLKQRLREAEEELKQLGLKKKAASAYSGAPPDPCFVRTRV